MSENGVLSNFSVGYGEGYLIPGRDPSLRAKARWDSHQAIGILSPCLAHVHAVTSLNFLSSPGAKVVHDRSAVTGSRKKSVKISAPGHAKSGDLSSIVDPKGSERM